jgi:hypothetical protein
MLVLDIFNHADTNSQKVKWVTPIDQPKKGQLKQHKHDEEHSYISGMYE